MVQPIMIMVSVVLTKAAQQFYYQSHSFQARPLLCVGCDGAALGVPVGSLLFKVRITFHNFAPLHPVCPPFDPILGSFHHSGLGKPFSAAVCIAILTQSLWIGESVFRKAGLEKETMNRNRRENLIHIQNAIRLYIQRIEMDIWDSIVYSRLEWCAMWLMVNGYWLLGCNAVLAKLQGCKRALTNTAHCTGQDLFDAIQSTHDTDGMLLLSSAMCLCCKFGTELPQSLITRKSKNMPAISRSELVIDPCGLWAACSWFLMTSGHCRQRIQFVGSSHCCH